MLNQIELAFPSRAENESLARMVIGAFLVQVNPTLSIISEIRTAVSEAVTNAVVHGYGENDGRILLRAVLDTKNVLTIDIEDFGCGMADVRKAMEPFFTTQPEKERTGIGFTLMQSFMDDVKVYSSPGSGTTVRMIRHLSNADE